MKRLKISAFLFAFSMIAACANMDATGLSPQNAGDDGMPASSQAGTGESNTTPSASLAPTSLSAASRVQFAPVIGAPAEAVQPLSARLVARAAQRGLTITSSATNATLMVKGYFSTITENGTTSVIYVWDVLDAAGNRLHRIQGQEPARGGQGEGWSAVSLASMEAIADQTIDELARWLSANAA